MLKEQFEGYLIVVEEFQKRYFYRIVEYNDINVPDAENLFETAEQALEDAKVYVDMKLN